METWKEVTWTNGRYYVSDEGRVMTRNGRKKKPYSEDGIMRPVMHTQGYYKVNLFVNRKYYTCLVHDLVMAAFVGDSHGMDVNHKNGIKTDNRLSNLEYCTRRENSIHAIRTGLRGDVRRVAALKDGKIVHKADFSREMAEWVKNELKTDTDVETIARSIRKRMDTGRPYKGYTFIKI